MAFYVKARRVGEEIGPGEILVEVETTEGRPEEIIVHEANLEGDLLEVGPIRRNGNSVLVEFPNESVRGRRRVSVPIENFKRKDGVAA